MSKQEEMPALVLKKKPRKAVACTVLACVLLLLLAGVAESELRRKPISFRKEFEAFAVVGRVVDFETREPVPSAKVKGWIGQGKVEAWTDESGRFVLTLLGNGQASYRLEFWANGYEPKEISGILTLVPSARENLGDIGLLYHPFDLTLSETSGNLTRPWRSHTNYAGSSLGGWEFSHWERLESLDFTPDDPMAQEKLDTYSNDPAYRVEEIEEVVGRQKVEVGERWEDDPDAASFDQAVSKQLYDAVRIGDLIDVSGVGTCKVTGKYTSQGGGGEASVGWSISTLPSANTCFYPAHVQGDRELWATSDKPTEITLRASVGMISSTELRVRVYMLAKETQEPNDPNCDFTKFEGVYERAYSPSSFGYAGWEFESLEGDLSSSASFEDRGEHSWFYVYPSDADGTSGELVNYFYVWGDSQGEDSPRVRVYFNPITVKLSEPSTATYNLTLKPQRLVKVYEEVEIREVVRCEVYGKVEKLATIHRYRVSYEPKPWPSRSLTVTLENLNGYDNLAYLEIAPPHGIVPSFRLAEVEFRSPVSIPLTLQPTFSTGPGSHTIEIRAYDAGGRLVASENYTLQLGSSKPSSYTYTTSETDYRKAWEDYVVLRIEVVGEGSTSPEPGVHLYKPGTTVELSAWPAQGWVFDSWQYQNHATVEITEDGAEPSSISFELIVDYEPSTSLVLDQDLLARLGSDILARAHFRELPKVELNDEVWVSIVAHDAYTMVGSHIFVESVPGGLTLRGEEYWTEEGTVDIEAVAEVVGLAGVGDEKGIWPVTG